MSTAMVSKRWHRAGLQRPFPLDFLALSDRTAARLRWVARGWIALVTAGFLVMAWRGGIPRSPSRDDWEIYAQLALLAMVAVAGLTAWRWHGVGALVITVGAVGLGALAAMGHHPIRALGVTLAFYLPGLLFWLDWQRAKSPRAVATLAAALVLTLAVGGYAANRVYATYFGPVQPESSLVAEPVTLVEWIWTGATTADSVTVKARTVPGSGPVRLAVSTAEEMTDPVYWTPVPVDAATDDQVSTFAVRGLRPETAYWYAVEADGTLDLSRQGRFQTFPTGPASFTFAFGACATEGSNGAVFDTIRELDPLFFLITGDLYYANIAVNDPQRFWTAFDRTLTAPAQAALYRAAPIAYIWDDHDFGPNDADSTAPSREAAQTVYRRAVPHYALPAGDGAAPVYQAFTVGRVRFILTDTRSARVPESAPDDAGKTMLGAEQKEWFKRELLAANGRYPVIVWVSTDPWIAEAAPGAAGWGSYATERRELADFIADNDIQGLAMLAGDAHMLAIDDGTNSDYSTDGGAEFPVFHAGALDRHGSMKGGPYSEGAHPGGGQFGVMTVEDDGGGVIAITWSGRTYKGEDVVGYRFTVPVRPVEVATAS